MRARNTVAFVAAVSILFIYAAQAQFDPRETPPLLAQPPNQNACPPDASVGAPRSNETTGSRTLSDQLAESKGVICPPVGVDPGSTPDRRRPHAGDSTAGNPRRRSKHSAEIIAAVCRAKA
jgi:hypothetical protein